MGRAGKAHRNSGRARVSRHRDRAQLEFDDWFIDETLHTDESAGENPLPPIPVRFGAGRLANEAPSAVVDIAPDCGDDDTERFGEPLTVTGISADSLFDLIPDSATGPAPPTVTSAVSSVNTVQRGRALHQTQRPKRSFTWKGVAEGVLLGAGLSAPLLLILKAIF